MEIRSMIPTLGWKTLIVQKQWYVLISCRKLKLFLHQKLSKFIPPLPGFRSQAFVEEQNKLTMPYLEQCAVRAQFHQRLTELYDYPKYSCPYKRGKRYGLKFKDSPSHKCSCHSVCVVFNLRAV